MEQEIVAEPNQEVHRPELRQADHLSSIIDALMERIDGNEKHRLLKSVHVVSGNSNVSWTGGNARCRRKWT